MPARMREYDAEMEEEEEDMPVFGDNLMEMMNTQGNYPMAIDDLSDDEKEDYYIKDTDALIVAGKIVRLLLVRKRNTRVWRSTCTSRRRTTCSCTTRSCCRPSPWPSSGCG